VLPALSHLLQHGFGANPVILSCVLKIHRLQKDNDEAASDGAQSIRPMVIAMFKNNERGTRINLLKAMPKFIEYLDRETVSKLIFPQLINGFTDSSPVLRECSVRSVLHFAPKLEPAMVTKQLLPLLERIQQNDVEPAIRTNICIVLGKVAKMVNVSENEQLFVKCFGRALNDSFMPCRNASLQSFAANIGLFSAKTIATQILPFIVKYTLDPHKSVRDSSFKCMHIGIEKLKQHALTLPDQPRPNGAAAATNASSNANDSAQSEVPASQSASYLSSWAKSISQSAMSPYKDNEEDAKDKNVQDNKDTTKVRSKPRSGTEDSLDDLFGSAEPEQTMKKTKKKPRSSMRLEPQQKEPETTSGDTLDDFLSDFMTDTAKNDSKPEKQNKTQRKAKRKKAKTKARAKAKEKEKAEDTTVDDFFDDW